MMEMNQINKEEVEEIVLERASNGRRFSATLLDLFLSLLIGFVLLALTFTLIENHPNMIKMNKTREEISINSGLYVKGEKTLLRYNDTIKDNKDLSFNEKSDLLHDKIYTFYTEKDFFDKTEGLKIYHNELKEAKTTDGKSMFTASYTRALTNSDYDESYYNFYDEFFDCTTGYLLKNSSYFEINQAIILIYSFSIVLTLSLPFILFFYLIPLCFVRTRQTIGMKVCRIALVDYTGLSVRPLKFTLRFLFFFIFIVVGSMLTFLIPMAISITMMVLSKSHQSLTDYLSGTYYVSIDNRNIYKDIYEYELSKKGQTNIKIEDENYRPVN